MPTDGLADQRGASTLSAMLASFPPPGAGSPTPSNRSRDRLDQIPQWPTVYGPSKLHAAESAPSGSRGHSSLGKSRPGGRRRCCGLSPWAFASVLILLALLVAAAVVIPVALIVLPRQNQPPAASTDPLANCTKSTPCGANGVSVVAANACRCICTNGFTGSACANAPLAGAADCTVQDADGYGNATLGADVPRLLAAAQGNFSIPLNATALLAAFSAAKVSCSDENNLVRFAGVQRRGLALPPDSIPLLPFNDALRRRAPGAAPASSTSASSTAAPTILVDLPPSPTTSTAATGSGTATPTSTAGASGPKPTDVDFARTAVLYVLQVADLDAAADARTKLQRALGARPFVADAVDVRDGISVDFLRVRVTANGTTVGA